MVLAEWDTVHKGIRRGQELRTDWPTVRFLDPRERNERLAVGPRIDFGAVCTRHACFVRFLFRLFAAVDDKREISLRLQQARDVVLVLDRQAGAALCLVETVEGKTTNVFSYLGPPLGRGAEVFLLAPPHLHILLRLFAPLSSSSIIGSHVLYGNHC